MAGVQYHLWLICPNQAWLPRLENHFSRFWRVQAGCLPGLRFSEPFAACGQITYPMARQCQEQIQGGRQSQMCLQAPLAMSSRAREMATAISGFPLHRDSHGDRANTRGSHCDPQQAGMSLHPELPFMLQKGSLHLSAQTVAHESTQLLFAGRWVFVFLF